MRELATHANDLVDALLKLSETEHVSILDSCGVGHLGSHLLIAGIKPLDVAESSGTDADRTLADLERSVAGDKPAIFTLSYEFGRKLLGIDSRHSESTEPDVTLALFDELIVHDYATGRTVQVGDAKELENLWGAPSVFADIDTSAAVTSNLSRNDYLAAVEEIKERIRAGDTYQTNLTQQLTARRPAGMSPQQIFRRLRRDHPAPFAAFIARSDSTVISASPERFFRITDGRISTSPIKGTRPRGGTPDEDAALHGELLASEKDRAENTMIVDLLRNDLGRVCEYGSVGVDSLCEMEEHPTYRHLVSTVSGDLRSDASLSDILKAVFPCGSITGAPKISTMRIIDELEPVPRGLSMGAIGYYLPKGEKWDHLRKLGMVDLDVSVAIRTMVIRDKLATFNVGGGITIDSDPEAEYDESLLKAKALLDAIGGRLS